jgi:hypothetical protein
VFLTVESLRRLPLVNRPIDQPAWRHCCWNFLCAEVHRLLLWKFQGAPRFLGLGVPAGTLGTLERNAGRHGWLSVGVAIKINQAPRQGIKELRPPVSGRLAGKVRVDQADGGGTFAHRCCHPFD